VDEIRALLEYGNYTVDLLNQGDYDHRTALHLAAGEGQFEIVKLLCQEGANVDVEDRWHNRPLDDAANAKKNSERIIKILTQYGATSVKNPSLHCRVLKKSTSPPDLGFAATDDSILATQSSKRTSRKNSEAEAPISGTIAYWPPELFSDTATPTPASDMWAVGVIMFILLTGS